MSATTADDRLAAAWEKARRLPDYRKDELVDLIELLTSWAEDDDGEEALSAEDAEAVHAVLRGEDRADVPLDEVMRESRGLGNRVLD